MALTSDGSGKVHKETRGHFGCFVAVYSGRGRYMGGCSTQGLMSLFGLLLLLLLLPGMEWRFNRGLIDLLNLLLLLV